MNVDEFQDDRKDQEYPFQRVEGEVKEEREQKDQYLFDTLGNVYKNEIQRSTRWRRRLDSTSNWAVATTAGILTFTFGDPARLHLGLTFGIVIALLFMGIEARRYRFYDVWRSRVRVIEENFVAPILDHEMSYKSTAWRDVLADDLRQPQFKVEYFESLMRRCKRIYFGLIALLVTAWFGKIFIHPVRAQSVQDLIANAGVGTIPGEVFIALHALLLPVLSVLMYFGLKERQAKGGVKKKHDPADWRDV